MLNGRTLEEALKPKKCFKGYSFSKGSKPSLQLAADMAKKAAEAEEAAAAASKGKEEDTAQEGQPSCRT